MHFRYIEDPSEEDELYTEDIMSLKFLKETKVASIQHPFSSTKEPLLVSGQISNLSAIPSKSSSIREKLAVILISLSNENSNGLFELSISPTQPLKMKLLLGVASIISFCPFHNIQFLMIYFHPPEEKH